MSDLRDHLQSIYDRHSALTPVILLDEAEHVDDPLHARFDWDDASAGRKHRLRQAHELIQSVKIVYRNAKGLERDIRAFHCVRNEEGYTYKPVDNVLKDPLLTQLVLQDMERDWRTLRTRYEQFDEFRQMVLAEVG